MLLNWLIRVFIEIGHVGRCSPFRRPNVDTAWPAPILTSRGRSSWHLTVPSADSPVILKKPSSPLLSVHRRSRCHGSYAYPSSTAQYTSSQSYRRILVTA